MKRLLARCGRPIEVVAVTARSRGKKRDADLKDCAGSTTRVALATDPEIDVFVELIGGAGDPAQGAVEAALDAGKSVVTANKALLARTASRSRPLAEKSKRSRSISRPRSPAASRSSRRCARGWSATASTRVYGILNGTCNYILTRMEQEKLSFARCLAEAQRLGYAEADPTFDIDGHDTAQKLAILASLAFGTEVDPDAIYVEGISSIAPADLEAADELGYRVKLLGVAQRTDNGHRAARASDHGAEGSADRRR